MGSVDWKQKCHGGGETKAILRHCDKDMRLEDNHKNKQIDKSRTHLNWQLVKGYNATKDKYDSIMDELDKKPKANKRHDRVTCFGLEYPAPLGLPEDKCHEWHMKVLAIENAILGEETLLNSYEHYDEVHEYRNAKTGEKTMSRIHFHDLRIPIVDGKLNGKNFSARKNMIRLNDEIQLMTEQDYGLKFMDGTGKKSQEEVETLKAESRSVENKAEEVYKNKLADLSKESYDKGFIEFLEHKTLKSGKTVKSLLEHCQREYEKTLVNEAEKEIISEPVAHPERATVIIQDEEQEEKEKKQVEEVLTHKSRNDLPRKPKVQKPVSNIIDEEYMAKLDSLPFEYIPNV